MKEKTRKAWNNKLKKHYVLVKLLFMLISIVILNWTMQPTKCLSDGIISTILFYVLITGVIVEQIYEWRKKEDIKISTISLVYANLISIMELYGADYRLLLFNNVVVISRVIVYVVLILDCLVVIWIAKKKKKPFFQIYLIICLFMLIFNYAGLYQGLDSLYFHYDEGCFSVNTGMSYEEAALAGDYIYYSADNMFGTDISNVSLRYTDYYEWDNSLAKKLNIDPNNVGRVEKDCKIIIFIRNNCFYSFYFHDNYVRYYGF